MIQAAKISCKLCAVMNGSRCDTPASVEHHICHVNLIKPLWLKPSPHLVAAIPREALIIPWSECTCHKYKRLMALQVEWADSCKVKRHRLAYR